MHPAFLFARRTGELSLCRPAGHGILSEELTAGRPASERECPMEFHEKLQELRKQKGMTQDELAEKIFVSRTAVSKWESGRGYPNIESLKAIAKFFGVTVDELLSGEELLAISEEDGKKREDHLRDPPPDP